MVSRRSARAPSTPQPSASTANTAQAARAFAVLALLQLGWGALALVARHRLVAAAGIALNVGAIGGWVLAKTLRASASSTA